MPGTLTHGTIESRPVAVGVSVTRPPSRAFIWLPLALFAGLIGFQLFGPVPIGLANNRDFDRVLGPLRLWPPGAIDNPDLYFKYFVNDYIVTDPVYDLGVPSSEQIIASLAKRIGSIILPAGTFQLRLMGLLHAAILVLAFFIFLKALQTRPLWLRLLCGCLLIFIWTDLEYVQQLSTAYTDAGAVVALAVIFAIAVHCLLTASNWRWALGFTLSGSFLLATKTQHEIALPFLIGFCNPAVFRRRGGGGAAKYDRLAWLLAPALLAATTAWMIRKTPEDYRVAPAFSVVFFKLAVLSPDPPSVLAHFQMPEDEFGKYIGHHAYEPDVPMGDAAFRRRIVSLVTPASLGSYYWRHPRMLGKVLLFDLRNYAPDVQLSHTDTPLGHVREKDLRSGKRPFDLVAWGRLRRQLFSVAPLHLIYFFGAAIVLCGFCILNPAMGRRFPAWPVALFSALLAVSSFMVASLFDAVETSRHLVFFQAATDLTIFSVVISICLMNKQAPPQEVRYRVVLWGRFRLCAQPVRIFFQQRLARRFAWLAPAVVVLWLYRGNLVSDLKPLKSHKATHIFDGANDEIRYSGSWTHGLYPQAVDGTESYSNAPAASAHLSFRGTEITWVYARAWNRGIGSVKIDGVPRGDIDLYSPKIIWQSRTTFGDLTPGKHTFELTVTGRKDAAATDRYIDIDALIVH